MKKKIRRMTAHEILHGFPKPRASRKPEPKNQSTVQGPMESSPRSWWPYDRRQELEELQTLLNELESINRGSSALERIARCIELARKLNHFDRAGRRVSFIQFLEDESFTGERPTSETAPEALEPPSVLAR